MGNGGSSNLPRERHKSGSTDLIPGSPLKGLWNIFFVFSRKIVFNYFLINISSHTY